MTVRVRLFASLRERLGTAELLRQVPEHTTAADLLASLQAEFPALAGSGRLAIAINEEYVDGTRTLADGDEVALIPPVSGGCLPLGRAE